MRIDKSQDYGRPGRKGPEDNPEINPLGRGRVGGQTDNNIC